VIWVWAILAGIVFGAVGVYGSARWAKGMITEAGRPQDTSTVIAMGIMGGLDGFIIGFLAMFALLVLFAEPP